MSEIPTNTLIIGASLSGLSCAASLQKQNIDYLIIEKLDQVGAPWRSHYERLHLHTNKRVSNLPYKKFGKNIPRYPERLQVIEYLDEYRKEFKIEPIFNTEALSIRKIKSNWITETNNGSFQSKYLVMATGAYSKPRSIHFNGMENFKGAIVHSKDYVSGKVFKGQKVLVVGFGNSACEIAIDLYEQGAFPAMAVRSPVNVVPREIFGIPVLELAQILDRLPPRVADLVSEPLIRVVIGDITKLGLRRKKYGAMEGFHRDGNPPVLDIGTIQHIRKGHIEIFGDLDHIEEDMVIFKDGRKEKFNAIVAGIGFYRDYDKILQVEKDRFEDLSNRIDKQKYFGKDGLYFCGYWISPTGQISEIARDAIKIAKDIAGKEKI